MAKVKPYIITIKYAAFYEDPRPTVEQVLNELNVDALEVLIEEAVVTAKPKASMEVDVESRTITYHNTPDTAVVEAPKAEAAPAVEFFDKGDAPFDVYNLDRNGPSMKILSLLYRDGKKGRTIGSIREVTALPGASAQVTVSRLKKLGRIKVIGKDSAGSSVYAFVK